MGDKMTYPTRQEMNLQLGRSFSDDAYPRESFYRRPEAEAEHGGGE